MGVRTPGFLMSDEELPSGTQAINLEQVYKGAESDIKDVAKGIIQALSASSAPEADKKAVTRALAKALQEVNPKNSPYSSRANDGEDKHVDAVKKDAPKYSLSAGQVVGAAGEVTHNGDLKQLSDEMMNAERAKNFQGLEIAAAKCGITHISVRGNKVPLGGEGGALDQTKKNVETIVAIKSLRDNGFAGENIYGTDKEIAAFGTDKKAAVRGFVRDCADRLAKHKRGVNPNDQLEFLVRPKAVTQDMRNAVAEPEKLGPVVRGKEADELKKLAAANTLADSMHHRRASISISGAGSATTITSVQVAKNAVAKESEDSAADVPLPAGSTSRRKKSAALLSAPIPAMLVPPQG